MSLLIELLSLQPFAGSHRPGVLPVGRYAEATEDAEKKSVLWLADWPGLSYNACC